MRTSTLLSAASRRRNPDRPLVSADSRFAVSLLLPGAVVVGGVLLFPLVYSFWTSLNEVSTADLSMRFDGVANYVNAVRGPFFLGALVNTLYFAALSIVGTVVLGLLIAVALNEPFYGRNLMRALVILPWAISQVVVGIIWDWIYNGTFGVLNAALASVGIIQGYVGWLSNPQLAMTLVAIAFVWSSVPFAVVMYLAALQSIPVDLYKAARVDGAGVMARFRFVTLPALRYTTLIVLIIASLDGLLAFSLIYVMTGGGPGTATTVLSWLGYQTTFVNLRLGEGAAIFYVLVFLMLGVAAAYIRLLHRPTTPGVQ